MNIMLDFDPDATGAPVPDALLAPLAPESPCGPPMRHDPVFTEIRLLREEDDPSLPMRQWERPLKCAGWPRIEALCVHMLGQRSKDLQIAVWLAESWMRQHGLGGLAHGLRLVDALLRRYWPQLHPVIDDDGDSDARLAPLEWLNEALGASVRLHAVLFVVEGDKPAPVTLAAWERMAARDMARAAGAAGADPEPDPLTRADVDRDAAHILAASAAVAVAVGDCLDALRSIIACLHDELGDGAPNLTKLETTLEATRRVFSQLQPDLPAPAPAASGPGGQGGQGGRAAPVGPVSVAAAAVAEPAPAPANWRNRGEAYATLEALADYLSEVEPHSPTPFLIRRAVKWGRMSLPEVIAEIIREEGDVSRLFNVLGIKL